MKKCYLLFVSVAVFAQACTTCPPCVPEHTIIDNPIPVYSCPAPGTLPPLMLPPWPTPPPDDAKPVQVKDWYADMAEVQKARETILRERIDELDAMLETYRGQ